MRLLNFIIIYISNKWNKLKNKNKHWFNRILSDQQTTYINHTRLKHYLIKNTMINKTVYVLNAKVKWNTKMMKIKIVNFYHMIYTVWVVIINLTENSMVMYNKMSMLIKTVLKSEQTILIFFYNFYNTIKRMDQLTESI